MDIISRKEAQAVGLKTYYTGQPCTNGHISYRYTQSGTCRECINGPQKLYDPNPGLERLIASREETAAKVAAMRQHSADLAQLEEVRVRVHDVDREAMAQAAWAVAVMRYPTLTVEDVDPKRRPTDRAAGTAMYYFRCPSADVPTLVEIAKGMISAHSAAAQVTAQRDAVIRDALQAANVDTAPPINYK